MKPKSLKSFLGEKFVPPVELISPGILAKGHILFLYGDEASWKSWLAMYLSFSFATGDRWLHWQTVKCVVLLVNPEILAPLYQQRLDTYSKKHGFLNGNLPDGFFLENDMNLRLDTAFGAHQLEEGIIDCKADVVILDGLYKVVSTDVVSGTEARRIIDNLDLIRSRLGTTFIIVHHTRQGLYDMAEGHTIDQGVSEMYGSSLYRNWADTILTVKKEGRHELDVISIIPQKYRLALDTPLSGTYQVDRPNLRFDYILRSR
jgi:RecA-family ATPase